MEQSHCWNLWSLYDTGNRCHPAVTQRTETWRVARPALWLSRHWCLFLFLVLLNPLDAPWPKQTVEGILKWKKSLDEKLILLPTKSPIPAVFSSSPRMRFHSWDIANGGSSFLQTLLWGPGAAPYCSWPVPLTRFLWGPAPTKLSRADFLSPSLHWNPNGPLASGLTRWPQARQLCDGSEGTRVLFTSVWIPWWFFSFVQHFPQIRCELKFNPIKVQLY